MKRYIKSSRLSHDVDEYQEWIDYDMKHYDRISKKTLDDIEKAGFTVTRDQYGDYEITASKSIYADESADREIIDTEIVNIDGQDSEIYLCHEPDEDYYYIDFDDGRIGVLLQKANMTSDLWAETENECRKLLNKIINIVDGKSTGVKSSTKCVRADTVKKGNKWVNRGDTGEEHGEFKTKKEADAQRRAMFVNKK